MVSKLISAHYPTVSVTVCRVNREPGLTKEAKISARNTRKSPKFRSWNALNFCHTVVVPGVGSGPSAPAGT